jgi:hypothetical protein
MLARWSNLITAMLHWAINSSGVDHYSIPFLYDPTVACFAARAAIERHATFGSMPNDCTRATNAASAGSESGRVDDELPICPYDDRNISLPMLKARAEWPRHLVRADSGQPHGCGAR